MKSIIKLKSDENYLIIFSTQLLYTFVSFFKFWRLLFCFLAYKELSFISVFFRTEFAVPFFLIPIPPLPSHPPSSIPLHFLLHTTFCPLQHLVFLLMAVSV